uniref:Succinate-semialdehyde dehydrogenase, mitochondrial n=1 Tax=Attheya septentrionalis TaxID=420275 RepID=A0A7S2XRR2_9STRA|mmetsp:Transcript_23800/g.42971  ORF Transcript_23800/g.42971 Transcript_23800/m.42971 type:complete len:476 (+) Transcript_23800:320-1747(+)
MGSSFSWLAPFPSPWLSGIMNYPQHFFLEKAIEKASSVFPSWRDGTTAHERSAILSRWSYLIKENTDDIATIMTLESGKPIQESQGEVAYGASFLDYYAAEAIRPTSAGGGFLTPTPFTTAEGGPRGKVIAVQEAVGVTALITPWNFPIAMITRKVGPALATGCTALVKPSELTPLTAIALKTLADRAGVPDGVFDLITCDSDATPDVGKEMCSNILVKKISFTGSTRVGKQLMKLGSDTVKRLSLELGGNAPFIVFEDADINQAVNAAMASKFRNAGQTCVCADRFLIHASVEEEFLLKLKEKVNQLSVNPGIDKGTTMGPLISSSAVLNVQKKVSEALDDGAECIAGGSPLEHLGPHFFEPTILRNVSLESRIWNSETFGPVAAIRTFETEEEAIQVANDSSTGLAAYFCSKDLARVFRVAGKLENGLVGVNDGIISTASAPFGGVKESGFGREGSQLGIAEYLNTKYIFLNV